MLISDPEPWLVRHSEQACWGATDNSSSLHKEAEQNKQVIITPP